MLEIPEFDISITSCNGGFSLSEWNGVLKLNVAVGRPPDANITIPVLATNPGLVTLSDSVFTFTPSNWSRPQILTVTGIDNFITDGNKNIGLSFGPVSSPDPTFDGYSIAPLDVTVVDNETDSIVVSPASGLFTRESGSGSGLCTGANSTATFTVVMGSQPSAGVTIPSITPDATEGAVDKNSLVFTPADYSIPQTVTVSCLDDNVLDGDITYDIVFANAVTTDPVYNSMPVGPVSVTNFDNELPSVTVTPLVLNLTEGGATGSFSVVLNNAPPGPAGFSVTSADPARATVDQSLLTFTPANYNTPQTVTVTPVDNNIIDVPPVNSVQILIGSSVVYANTDPPDVTVNVADDDIAGVYVSNLSSDTTESGQSATFDVRLLTQPSANVSIAINETNDPKNAMNREGTITGDPVTLVFTPANWNVTRQVQVNGVDDYVDDDHIQYIIQLENAISADPFYNGITPSGVTVNNLDDDVAGFTITGAGLITDDMGNLDKVVYSTFSVQLDSEPISDVWLNLTSSRPDDGTPDTGQLFFTAANWNIPQSVSVHVTNNGGTPNHINEGNRSYSINMARATSDPKYTLLADPSVTLQSCDNDGANLVIGCAAAGTSTSENHGTATVWFITQTQPSQNITVPVSSGNINEAVVTSSALITPTNWNTLNPAGTNLVTATGVDEPDIFLPPVFDGNTPYLLLAGVTTSADPLYANYNVNDLQLRNVDNEQAFLFDTAASVPTTEAGGSTTFGIRLAITPTADVTVTLACGSPTECAGVSPAAITFPAGSSLFQPVTIAGKDDNAADGDQPNCVSFGILTTTDPVLDGITPPQACPVMNLDDDKRIWVTNYTYLGNFNATIDMVSIDSKCDISSGDPNHPNDGNLYKALIAHNVFRVGTTNGTDATGQTGWPLAPDTKYYLKEGAAYTNRVFTTDAFGLVPFNLAYPFNGTQAWTGFNPDWTTSVNNCGDWADSVTPGISGQYGLPGVIDSTAFSFAGASCLIADAVQKSLICVQQ